MDLVKIRRLVNDDVNLPLNKIIGETFCNGERLSVENHLNRRDVNLPYKFTNGCAVVYNGEIHILGGSGNTTKHYKWNGSSWTSVSTLPYGFNGGGAVVYNDEIHILGDYDKQTKHYKWTGSSWTSVSTLPCEFHGGSAVVYNDEIHILGGYTKHYKWNGSSWTSVSTIPYNFYSDPAVVFNNEIHILGGGFGDTNHYKWNGSSWTSVSTLPYGFYLGSAVVYNNEIHILGGAVVYSSGIRIGNETGHYKWNGSSWTSVSTLPYNFYSGSAVVYNNEIHILGGGGANSSNTNHYSFLNNKTWDKLHYFTATRKYKLPNGRYL